LTGSDKINRKNCSVPVGLPTLNKLFGFQSRGVKVKITPSCDISVSHFFDY